MAVLTMTANVRIRRLWLIRLGAWVMQKASVEIATQKGRHISSIPVRVSVQIDEEA